MFPDGERRAVVIDFTASTQAQDMRKVQCHFAFADAFQGVPYDDFFCHSVRSEESLPCEVNDFQTF